MRTVVISMVALFAGIPAAACGQPTQPPATEKPKPKTNVPAPTADDAAALVTEGQRLFSSTGCLACHSVDGARRVGPSVKGLYGSARTLVSGEQVPADEAYLRRSMVDPLGQLVKGYPPSMPSYNGQLQPAQLDALVAYMKSLGATPKPAEPPPTPGK